MNSSKNINKKRIKNIIIFFITLLFILVLRISYITIINGKEYASMALEQWTSEKSIDENRGNILDRNGEILVLNTNLYKIDLNLDLIKEYAKNNNTSLENIAKSISEILICTSSDTRQPVEYSTSNSACSLGVSHVFLTFSSSMSVRGCLTFAAYLTGSTVRVGFHAIFPVSCMNA